MKKILLIILIVLVVENVTSAQPKKHSIIGIWQIGSPQISSAWQENYRFFPNGTFKYTFSPYDDRKRIIAAKGNFRLHGDTLTLIIRTRIELIGGDLVGGSPGVEQDEFVLDATKTVEVKQKKNNPY